VLRRWPVVHLDVPAGVPKLPVLGIEPQQIVMAFGRTELIPVRPLRHRGLGAHPDRGAPPSSSATTAATSTRWRSASPSPSAGRPVRFLGKKEVFDAPVVGQALRAMGGIRVDRGTGSDEPLRRQPRR
jgi:putative phosphoserine phosphatase/1-acylglycerol-3-phosphate O-acyltransferase